MLTLQKKIRTLAAKTARKTMASQPVAQIQYLSPDGIPWRAALSEVKSGLFPGSTSDPEFLLYQGTLETMDCQSPRLNSKAPDGSLWSSRCRSYTNPVTLVITFRFEHWRHGHESGPPHQISDELCFLDWDDRPWIASVNSLDSPGSPQFILRPAI